MLVMILEKAPTSLRGELSRWLIEPRAGVFLGNLSARVRDQLWARACRKSWDGSVLQLWSDTTSPQGYRYRAFGAPSRQLEDHEGIALVHLPPPKQRGKGEAEPLGELDFPGPEDAPPSL